jgi:hypothetical protein
MGEFGGAGGNAADARGKTGTELAAYGRTSKEIAAELGSSPDDVRRHLHSIFTKLNDLRPPDPLLPPAVSAALAIPREQPEDAIGSKSSERTQPEKGEGRPRVPSWIPDRS